MASRGGRAWGRGGRRQDAEAAGGSGRFGGVRNLRGRAEAQRGARGGGRRAQGRALTAEEEALQAVLEEAGRRKQAGQRRLSSTAVTIVEGDNSGANHNTSSSSQPFASVSSSIITTTATPTIPKGPATDHFEASLRYYHTALASSALSPRARLSVLFDIGEAYLGLGEAQLADGQRAAGGPMSQPALTWQLVKRVEREAATSAADSCRLAFEAFDEICRVGPTLPHAESAACAQSAADVSSGGGGRGGRGRGGVEGEDGADVAEMVQGAAVNAANALVAWAEAVGEVEGGREEQGEKGVGMGAAGGMGHGGSESMALDEQQAQQQQQLQQQPRAAQLLQEALARYEAAAAATPSDTDLLSNLGDCAVKMAELTCPERPASPHPWDQASPHYERAMQAYGTACSLCDARVGDDLPGLLHNWGVGLLSAAQRCPEPDQEIRLLTEAAEKLQKAADFHPTDMTSRLALGEVLSVQGERSASSANHLQEALHLLSLSLSRGFSAALRIDSCHAEALLGAADVHLSAAQLLMGHRVCREGKGGPGGGGGMASSSSSSIGVGVGNGGGMCSGGGVASLPREASGHLQHAMSAYRDAMHAIKASDAMPYADQCSALYNMACAAALVGLLAESAEVLTRLAAIGWLSVAEVQNDEDFRILRQSPLYAALLTQLHV
ncbi:hypothetical protein CLOM_g17500 [Closterium sp. NIES-68]|nr:hypothetical protein CLOM_g17500 [Closterium sp. NIES-68]GJP86496.1 hypothetical protein CLOP_g16515 [Closterium sp. NIES-67]